MGRKRKLREGNTYSFSVTLPFDEVDLLEKGREMLAFQENRKVSRNEALRYFFAKYVKPAIEAGWNEYQALKQNEVDASENEGTD